MLYLAIIGVIVLSLFFQIYNIEGVENKHSLFLSLDSLCGLYGEDLVPVKCIKKPWWLRLLSVLRRWFCCC